MLRNLLTRLTSGARSADRQRGGACPATPAANAERLLQEGLQLQRDNRLQEALERYREVLRLQPANPDALFFCGLAASDSGRPEEALEYLARAVAERGDRSEYHAVLADQARRLNDAATALAHYRRAVELDPGNAGLRSDYATALFVNHDIDAAIAGFEAAIALDPRCRDALYNLGNVYLQTGNSPRAAEFYRRCLEVDPDFAHARNNLGIALQRRGLLDTALEQFERAVAIDPGYSEAHNNIGLNYQLRSRPDRAEAHIAHAIELDPDYTGAYANLGLVQQEVGRHEEAEATYGQALARREMGGVRVRLATLLPVVPLSVGEIDHWRARFEERVSALLASDLRLDDPFSEVGACNFYLAFHGRNDRPLLSTLAEVYQRACPRLGFTAPHCTGGARRPGRLRIGFISRFMYQHSIGKTTRGLLTGLSREEFEVHALFVPPLVDDPVSRAIKAGAEHHQTLPDTLESARGAIAALELDVLFYQDIGMDPFTYFLAFSRLAPVQCLSFGFPDTTGIPNMDCFVSSEHFEPDDAAEHYSEELFELRGVGTLAYYFRPPRPRQRKRRADFGLDEADHLYVCAQSPFKLHPEFDDLLAEVLRRDPKGRLVMVQSKYAYITKLINQRFARSLHDVLDRVVFLPNQTEPDFSELMALCDVSLDPTHFSGMNTSLECLSVGTPVVTLPKAFQRGRHTYGMYRHLGIADAVARDEAHYVDIAVALGSEPERRRELGARILERNDRLFEDHNVIREFERYFRTACGA